VNGFDRSVKKKRDRFRDLAPNMSAAT